ncbi:MAG: acyl-CoA cholesterol acyltransferase [Planctomycetota bacterium]|nr:acyl-CoA cholesterol acyltransferase [Planctomycetota bacterium]
MERIGWLLLACAVAYGCALAVPLLGWWSRGRLRNPAGWCAAVGALACPLLIPADLVVFRAASAFVSTDVVFKMVDFLRHHRREWDGLVAREYCRFLIPFPVLSIVYPDHKRRLARPDCPWPHIVRILGGTAGVAAGIVLVRTLAANAIFRSSPALDHALRLVIFVPTIEAISRVLHGIERLAGFDTTPIIRNAFLSRTVSEFWRRYNGRMHDWYDRNVFRPSGGRRAPTRAVGLVFLVSGLHHELMFAIATSGFTGYQLAFFLAQAPAVLASGRLERVARRGGIAGKILAHGVTILFLSVTSVLFFHGVSQVFPSILANGSPLP